MPGAVSAAIAIWSPGAGILTHYLTRDPVHIHDLQATIMHLFGIDHERLTYKFQGRRYRLTDLFGKVVKGVLS